MNAKSIHISLVNQLSYICRVEDNICFSLKSIYMTFLDQKKQFTKIYDGLMSRQGQFQDGRH